jgi:leader peptidase (prepilin peptidase)/N-methyltransferase
VGLAEAGLTISVSAIAWARARPLGSLFAGAMALAALARYGVGAAGLVAAFTCATLVVLSVIDVESRRLPNRIVLPAALIVLVAHVAVAPDQSASWIGAAFGAAAFLFVFALAYPAGLGMGDVKLALLLGAALGSAILPALLLGTLAGAVAAVWLLVRHGARARRMTMPFGPFLAFGAIATMLLLAP